VLADFEVGKQDPGTCWTASSKCLRRCSGDIDIAAVVSYNSYEVVIITEVYVRADLSEASAQGLFASKCAAG
jgi:hypothetical protein